MGSINLMLKHLIVLFMLTLLTSTTFAQNDSRDFNGFRWFDDGISFIYPYQWLMMLCRDLHLSADFPAGEGHPCR